MTGAIRFLVFRVFSPLKMRTNFIIVARIRSFQRLTGVSISQKRSKKKRRKFEEKRKSYSTINVQRKIPNFSKDYSIKFETFWFFFSLLPPPPARPPTLLIHHAETNYNVVSPFFSFKKFRRS